MLLEYMLYIFIGIGFMMGAIRGWKKEIFAFISLLASLFCVLFLYQPLSAKLLTVVDFYQIYQINIVNKILGWFNISYFTFEFVIIGGLLFVLTFSILSIIINSVLFNTKRVIAGKAKESNKFLGGLIGLASGLVLGIFFMFPIISSNTYIFLNGYITPVLLYKLPLLSDLILKLLNFLGVAI